MPKPDTSEVITDEVITDEAPAAAGVKVRVPQDSGAIVINTFDSKTPNRYSVTGGVIDAPSQADADLLVARVDGASLI